MFRNLADFSLNVALARFPGAGTLYSLYIDRPLHESTAISAVAFGASHAGKRVAHAYLGSAGGMLPHQHAVQIVRDSFTGPTSPFKSAKRPPPSAFVTMGLGLYLVNTSGITDIVARFDPTSSGQQFL